MNRNILLFYIGCLFVGLVLDTTAFYLDPQPKTLYWGVFSGLCTVFASVLVVWFLSFFKKGSWYNYAVLVMIGITVLGVIILFILEKVSVAISLTGTQLIAFPLAWLGGSDALISALAVAGYSTFGMLIVVFVGAAVLFLLQS